MIASYIAVSAGGSNIWPAAPARFRIPYSHIDTPRRVGYLWYTDIANQVLNLILGA